MCIRDSLYPQVVLRWGGQKNFFTRSAREIVPPTFKTVAPPLAPRTSLLQNLTFMQQLFYQMKFRNVCEVKKRLVQLELVWRRTLSTLLSMNGESVYFLCPHSGQKLQALLLQAVKNGQLDEMSAKVSEM